MKKLKLFIAGMFLLLFSLFTVKADAQLAVSATIGPQVPTGDFGVVYGTGFGFTVTGRYFITDAFAIGLNLGYNHFNVTGLSDFHSGLTPVTALLEYHLDLGRWQPYAGGDLGLYSYSIKYKDPLYGDQSDHQSYFGIAPTIGVAYEVADNFSVLANLKINDVFGDGGSLSWVGINVGASYSFAAGSHAKHKK